MHQLFDAYLNCPTKCFLRISGEKTKNGGYVEWEKKQDKRYLHKGLRSLKKAFCRNDTCHNLTILGKQTNLDWHLAINPTIQTKNIQTTFHAIKQLPLKTAEQKQQFIPVRFVPNNKLDRVHRMMMAFDTFVLSQTLKTRIQYGEIIHGEVNTVNKINTIKQIPDVRKVLRHVNRIISKPEPPAFSLNRHCPECEFQERCFSLARKKDDLSLITGLSEKERLKLNEKGILSVNQLSYTFRPRRRSKKYNIRTKKYYHALKALAIREQKIYVAGKPELNIEGTPIFFDVEAIPDRDFYYLIGLLLQADDTLRYHALWANNKDKEEQIWSDFIDILTDIENPVLIHYGSFETTFLKKMCDRYGGVQESSNVFEVVKNSINILSVIYASVYFPTYSNGLKEIAQYLGFEWGSISPSGLHSLVWYNQWEYTKNPALKEKLIYYNQDDCKALELVVRTVNKLTNEGKTAQKSESFQNEVVYAETLKLNSEAKLGNFQSSVSSFEKINTAAYWNYQRNRVYLRTGIKQKQTLKTQNTKTAKCVNKFVKWKAPTSCPVCRKKWRKKGSILNRTVQDLVFGRDSLKRRFVQYEFKTYICRSCGKKYGLDKRFGHPTRKYGWNVLSYCVFNMIGFYASQNTIVQNLNRLFGFDLRRSNLIQIKRRAANYYKETRDSILKRILEGELIHVDETYANIKGHRAYVWVLTNLREVVYILTVSREGKFIQRLLTGFKGILVSDFYTAYDSIKCSQQKCLIHIIRNLNDDLFKNPFDKELQEIIDKFSSLLQSIIETIDKRGLKTYFLKKHIKDVEQFYKYLDKSFFRSELALKYMKRFEKNRNKLFTFLHHDSVPWNNNNAEHAIKSFAMLRNAVSGTSTKMGTEEYLILLSVCRTCEYQNIDFLDFLLSGEKDIVTYANKKTVIQFC